MMAAQLSALSQDVVDADWARASDGIRMAEAAAIEMKIREGWFIIQYINPSYYCFQYRGNGKG